MRVRIEIPDRARPRPRQDDGRVAVALEELEASPGRPLPEAVRREMEARFGCDFSGVRIHQDARADSSAHVLGARAFTVGDHIFFRAGAFDPDRVDGRRLLAHELAHTLQQRSSIDPAASLPGLLTPKSSVVGGAEERRAREAAKAALTAKPAAIARRPAGPQAAPHVARWVEALPDDRAVTSHANPFVEELALDVVRALQRDPDDTGAHTQRRLARLEAATRAAVITRVQEQLTPAERERSAKALSGAVVSEEEPRQEPQPTTEPAAGQQPAQAGGQRERGQRDRGEEPAEPAEPEIEKPAPGTAVPVPGEAGVVDPTGAAKPAAERPAPKLTALSDRAKRPAGAPRPGVAPSPAAKPPGKQAPLAATAGKAAQGVAPAAGQRPGGRAPDEATPAAAAAQADGGDAPAQPDLGPADAMEAKLDARDRERQARAEARAQEIEKEAAETAAHAPGAEAAPAPPEPAAHAEALTTLEEIAASDAGGEPETATAEASEAATEAEPQAAAELEPQAAAEPEPAMAPEPEPTVAPEPEPAVAAEAEPPAGSEPAAANEPAAEVDVQAAPPPALEPAAAAEPTAAATEPLTPPEPVLAEEPAPPHEEAPAVERDASAAVRDETPGGEATAPAPAEDGVSAEPSEPSAAATGEAPTSEAESEAPAADQTATDDAGTDGAEDGPGAEAGGDSGDCGPDSPPGVGGGEGGGTPIPDPQPEPEPDVSQAAPEDAMATAATLAPGPMLRTLGGVQSAAQREVAGQRDDLAANPPSMERPTGSPQTRDGRRAEGEAGATAGLGSKAGRPDRSRSRTHAPKEVPRPLPPAPPSPTQAIQPPPINQGTQAPMTPQEVQAFVASIGRLPVSDPGLDVTAGPAPTVALVGDADPNQVTEQRTNVDQKVDAAAREGAQAAAAPLGEHNIYPAVPRETLRAKVKAATPTSATPKPGTAVGPGGAPKPAPAAGAGAAPGPAAVGAAPGAPGITAAPAAAGGGAPGGPDPAEIVAKEQSTADVQAAAADGQGQMVAGREAQESGVDKANADAKAEIDKEIADNTKAQEEQRTQTLSQVGRERGSWTKEQEQTLTKHRTDSDEQMRRVDTEVTDRRTQADKDAATEIQKGNDNAAKERRKAEEKAAAERKRREEESRHSGVLGWLADKARAAFNAIKAAIKDIFDAARKLVRDLITAAKNLAGKIIDAARDAIVSAIRSIGDALLKLGDVLLSAFPALHERYRKAIHGMVDAAVKRVDQLADNLKASVNKALDALGDAIDAVLAVYEKALLAAVSFVQKAAEAAIKAAQALVDMLAEWAQLIADIASDPLQWLSNLADSAKDGIRNHLWRAFKCAVKGWFRSKVEEVLGLPLTLFQVLKRGGIKFAEIVKMVWDGLIAAIPGILIDVAIEQIVAMIVPAAGAVMAIIRGLKAAWGTIKRIIAALEKFFAFLKAVKLGNAGRQFAELIASAAIVVLDFLANFLIEKFMKPAKPIGGRLAEIGKKIMARLGSVARTIGRGLRRAGQIVKAGAKKAATAIRRGAASLKRAAQKAGRAIAKVAGRAGRAIKRGAGKVVGAVRKGAGRAMRVIERRFPRVARVLKKGAGLVRRVGRRIRRTYRRARAWVRRKWAQRPRRPAGTPEQRLQRAVAALRPRVAGAFRRGVSGLWLRTQLLAWRVWYRLSALRVVRTSDMEVGVEARVNPGETFPAGKMPRGEALRGLIRKVVGELITSPEVRQAARHQVEQLTAGHPELGGGAEHPLHIMPGAGFAGTVVAQRWYQRVGGGRDVPFPQRLPFGRHITFGYEGHAVWERQAHLGHPGGFINIPALGEPEAVLIPPDLRRTFRRYPSLAPTPEPVLAAVTDRGRYPGMAREIRRLGVSDRRFARALSDYARSGELDPALERHGAYMTGLGYLMFGRESMRAPMNLAMAPMTMSLIASGRMDVEEAFAGHETTGRHGGGGAFPMSMRGAEAAAHELEMEHGAPTVRTADADELARREIAIAERWLYMEMTAAGLEGFADESQALDFIRRRLLGFYKVAIRRAR